MKAITLTQPWASLVIGGPILEAEPPKHHETRGWSTAYRGQLAIHAAKTFPADARHLASQHPFTAALRALGFLTLDALPLGAVLGHVNLVDVQRIISPRHSHPSPKFITPPPADVLDLMFGDWTAGRWAWKLADVCRYPNPIPARGALSLWDWWPGPD